MTESSTDAPPSKPAVALENILDRMKLTNPGDKDLLLKLIPWIQTQRPKFMFTSVLGLAVLIQRMGRAFAQRSSAPVAKYAAIKEKPPTDPVGATSQPEKKATTTTTAAPPQVQQPPKPKRKAFRSAKKLDLSPNVVASLKGFVADLAATIPLILKYVEHKQQRSLAGVPQLTAVDTIEVCLHMMEGEVAINNYNPNSTKEVPNAAMELYRKILDKATNNNAAKAPTTQNPQAATMDQLKFKTFCCKTLESAQSRTVSVVEALHDFRLLWNISYEQHKDLEFVPKDGTSRQHEELAWKLAYHIVWKRQEEHPDLCDRRERILASATSMAILCSLPLAHDHSNTPASPKQSKAAENPTTTNENNKRPMEETTSDVSSPAPKVLRVGESGSVHEGNATIVDCEICKRQERAIEIILDAVKQALSFAKWARPKRAIREGKETPDTNAKGEVAELERSELDRQILKVVKDLLAFSKYEPKSSDTWMDCLKAAVGIGGSDKPDEKKAVEASFVSLLEDAFAAMQRDEDERMGTRVEAVPYIEELALMKYVHQGFTRNLCKTTNDRRDNMSDLIACVPVTSHVNVRNAQRKGSDSANISEYQPKVSAMPMVDDAKNSSPAGSPPAMTEPIELNEWTMAVLSSLNIAIQPSPTLKSLLDQGNAEGSKSRSAPSVVSSIIAPLLNRYLNRMQQEGGNASRGAMPVIVGQDGRVTTRERTQHTQLCTAVVQLYYHSLESVLFFERTAASSAATRTAAFHASLLACCHLCMSRAMVITGKMQMLHPESHQVYSILPIAESTPYSYLKVTESFLRAQTSSIPGNETSKLLIKRFGSFPKILQREVRDSEMHVLESLLWVRDSSRSTMEGCIVNTIAELKQSNAWPPACLEPTDPDEVEDNVVGATTQAKHKTKHRELPFVTFVMRKLLKVANFRIKTICEALKIPSDYPVSSQVFLAFRFLLRNQVELMYGRHLDQWILCTIYGICKTMKYKPVISFGTIVETYTSVRKQELGDTVCSAIVRHVKILDAAGDGDENDQSYGSTKMGNIINLFNLVFVPCMKSFLLHSKTLKRDAKALRMMQQEGSQNTESRAPNEGSKLPNEPTVIRAGNVTIHITRSKADSLRSTAEMLMEREDGGATHEKFTSFLQFGRVAIGPTQL